MLAVGKYNGGGFAPLRNVDELALLFGLLHDPLDRRRLGADDTYDTRCIHHISEPDIN